MTSPIDASSVGHDAGVGVWLSLVVIAYVCGSIPFGLLLGKLRGVDIREHGSRNIGATNVGRVLGARLGLLCFVLDALKGAVPVALAGIVGGGWGQSAAALGPTALGMWLLVAVAALGGHMASPWLRFRGGKGVATGFGALLAIWPVITVPALLALMVWLIVLVLTRFVSLASIIAAAAMPVLTILWALRGDAALGATLAAVAPAALLTAIVAALVIVRHRANMSRLLAGTEPRLTTGRGIEAERTADRPEPRSDDRASDGPALDDRA